MAALKHVWKEEGPKLLAMPKESLSIGQVSHCTSVFGGLYYSEFLKIFGRFYFNGLCYTIGYGHAMWMCRINFVVFVGLN